MTVVTSSDPCPRPPVNDIAWRALGACDADAHVRHRKHRPHLKQLSLSSRRRRRRKPRINQCVSTEPVWTSQVFQKSSIEVCKNLRQKQGPGRGRPTAASGYESSQIQRSSTDDFSALGISCCLVFGRLMARGCSTPVSVFSSRRRKRNSRSQQSRP